MEEKILQFPSPQEQRQRSAYGIRRWSPTALEVIDIIARDKYMAHADRIRRRSMQSLSPEPFYAWGTAKRES